MSELEMLREFYRSWVAFHRIPRDKLHRNKQEAASQLMVDNAHQLQNYYKSQIPVTLRVVKDLPDIPLDG